MTEYVETGDRRVNKALHELVRDEIAPGTGVDAAATNSSVFAATFRAGPSHSNG